MKDLFVSDLARFENQVVTGFFLAATRQLRTKADGSSYLSLTLADSTGQIEARMWEVAGAGEFAAGDVLKLRGQVCRYQEKLQIKVDKLKCAEKADYDLADFLPKTPNDVSIPALWESLTRYVHSLTDPHLRALLQLFLDDPAVAGAWREAPAAKSMHHAWIGGLLEHVVSLLNLCERTAPQYPEIHRDLLLAGAMLHDIGKLRELHWERSFGYTVEGQLLGHISIGAGMIDEKIAQLPDFPPRLRTLLLHIILSHHGRLEYGSPKLPMTAEALLLHYLDDLDAKMQTLRSELARSLANGASAEQPTDYIRALERPLLDTRAWLAGS
jgi:3'-5' exoribonuclease